MRRSLRLTMKNHNYESPLRFLQQKRLKRQLEDELCCSKPSKRQKINNLKASRTRRSSVIIINDENDFAKKKGSIKGKKDDLADDSVIIIDDLNNESFARNSSQPDDIMVVYSSVPCSIKNKTSTNCPFEVDKEPNVTNLKMLRGEYPQRWLGDWLSEKNKKKNKRKTILSPGKNRKIKKVNKSPLLKCKKNNASLKKREKIAELLKASCSKNEQENEQKINKKTKKQEIPLGKLREIIIDGPNVAKAYTNGKFFSDAGLKIVVDFFKNKGHQVKAFVPQHVRSKRRQILEDLSRDGSVIFTPSRKAGSKVITPYDDRYILEYATKCDGIIISNDQFKDLYEEKPEWRDTIEKRILPPTFVGDLLMFPEDPLGRNGPKLDTFLRHEA